MSSNGKTFLNHETPGLRLIRKKPLCKKLGMSDDWIENASRTANFPAPIVLSTRSDGRPAAVAWDEHQVDEWLNARRMKPAEMPKPAEAPKRRGRKAIA